VLDLLHPLAGLFKGESGQNGQFKGENGAFNAGP
jgi:hypothetical protein